LNETRTTSNGGLGTITSGYYNAGGPKHSHVKVWGSQVAPTYLCLLEADDPI
jgi:hypothetical protein